MIRNIVFLLAVALLTVTIFTGCGRAPSKYSVTETDYSKAMATNVELAGCKAFYVEVDYRAMNVVRCPNSTTTATYSVGKSIESVTMIDESTNAASRKAEYEAFVRTSALAKLSTEEKELLGIK